MMRIVTYAVLCWFVLFAYASLHADNAYQIKKIDFDIPTSDNSVKQLIYDEEGTVWFYNSKGIYRFNGKHLTHINLYHASGRLLNNLSISAIRLFNHRIYVTSDRGLYTINMIGEVLKVPLKIANEKIADIEILKGSGIVLLTDDGKLVIDADKPTFKTVYLSDTTTNKLLVVDDTVYIAQERGGEKGKVLKFDKHLKLIKRYVLDYGIYANSITSINGKITVSANKRLLLLDPVLDSFVKSTTKFTSLAYIFPINHMENMFVESPNKIKIGKINESNIVPLNFNKNVIIYSILSIANNEYLIGTNAGIYILYKNKINYEKVDEKINPFPDYLSVRRQVIEDESSIYYLHYGGVIKEDKKSRVKSVLFKGEIYAYSGLIDGNTLWIGTDGGHSLAGINKHTGKLTWYWYGRSLGSSRKGLEVTSIIRGENDELILSCFNQDNVILFNTVTKSYREIPLFWKNKKLANFKVQKISRSAHGDILMATNIGLVVLDNNYRVTHYIPNLSNTKTGKAEEVHNIYISNNKTIWLALDNGIVELDPQSYSIIRFLNLNQKLTGRKCIFITEDHYKAFWIATYNGLFSYNDSTKNVLLFTSADGLPDDEYNFNACTRLNNGDIILGGLNAYIKNHHLSGYTGIAKSKINFAQVSLLNENRRELIVDNSGMKYIPLNKGRDVLQLSFALNDFLNPNLCYYYYKIDGYTDWTPIGNNGFLQLWSFPAKRNTILIRGINSQGNEAFTHLKLNIEYITPIYEQTWFLVLLSIVIGVLIVMFVLYRQYNYQKLRTIKNTLLYDIHDEIGSILTKTSMHAELMLLRNHAAESDIKFIALNVKEAMQALRNVLWTLDNESNDINNLIDRSRANLAFIFRDTIFEYYIENKLMNDRLDISIEMKRNVLLIIKEAAVNTLKYSKGDKFNVIFSQKEKKLNILIKDNGDCTLFDRPKEGYGLDSIEKRVKYLKGKLRIEADERGFEIEIEF